MIRAAATCSKIDHVRRYRFLLLILLPFLWWTCAGPASAHDELVSTTPSAGASVRAPSSVRLTFSDTVIKTGTKVEVRNPSGRSVAGPVAISARVVSVALPASVPAGSYRVLWRVTSADGHPVSGTFGFRATAAASSSPSSSTSDALQKDTLSASATPTQRVPTNATNNEPGWVLGAVAVAVVAIAAGVWFSRSRLSDDEPQDQPDHDES